MADNLTQAPPQWFIGATEYGYRNCTFKMLNCGEAVFGELHRAIREAKRSVSYICWGFQPSMYFVRNGSSPSIGELLEERALQGVKVRVLCWAFVELPGINATGVQGEANTPGRQPGNIGDRPKTHTKNQYEYDQWWYANFDRTRQQSIVPSVVDSSYFYGVTAEKRIPRPSHVPSRTDRELEKIQENLEFRVRGFTLAERQDIQYRAYTDKDISAMHRTGMAVAPSHHQKVVLIDVELPDDHVAFVMGHNTLDLYWDATRHSYRYYSGEPGKGRNVATPRQDLSSRVTGPVVGDLFSNFRTAWEKEGGKGLPDLTDAHFRNFPLYTSKLVACEAGGATRETVKATLGSIMTGGAQIIRTQVQNKPPRFDIRDSYKHVIRNASSFIYIENQYFRWPPMAEWIKEAALNASRAGRQLYLFVITNSSDEGLGIGTQKTWQMLDSLGRSDVIPGIARKKRIDDLYVRIHQIDQEIRKLEGNMPGTLDADINLYTSAASRDKAKIAELETQRKQLQAQLTALQSDVEGKIIKPEERPGLKTHICTLTAPDTPAGAPWPEVYVHSKLMMVDDVYMTLGSANINTRSMETDSEINIAHAQADITRGARRELWAQHTNGRGAQDNARLAFEEWGRIIDENRNNERDRFSPVASLRGFRRADPKITDMD